MTQSENAKINFGQGKEKKMTCVIITVEMATVSTTMLV